MLRACRKVLRPGGRTAYFTIVVAPDLSSRNHRRAVTAGPRAVASTRPMDELMLTAGFTDVHTDDVTEEFLDTAREWTAAFDEHEDELRELIGAEWDERQRDRRELQRAAEEGLMLRLFVTGRRD